MLEHLGLDEPTEATYRALLKRPDADIVALAAEAAMPIDEVKASLDKLAEKALVRWVCRDAVNRPQLIDPEVALRALLAQDEAELASRRFRLEQSRLAIAQLLVAQESNNSGDLLGVERLDNLAAVRERFDEMAATCQEEVWSFNPGGAQSEESLLRSRPANLATLERGVRMRALYLDSVRNDPASLAHAEWLVEMGAEVRTVATLPIRMLVVDRSKAVIPIDAEDSRRGALVVSGSGMVAGLVALFASTWKSARPIGPRPGREPGKPSAQELQALRLWAQGATDASVARSLGVSDRTVRRMSETLAERLGARSRFETGARAVDANWLTAEDLI